MERKNKNIMTAMAILCVVGAGIFGMMALSEDADAIEINQNGLRYILDDENSTAKINGPVNTQTTTVDIPAMITHNSKTYNVTEISAGSFWSCVNLKAIVVSPDSQSFASVDGVLYNKAMTKLIQRPSAMVGEYTFPSTVTTIGDYALSYYSGSSHLTIPEGVTTLDHMVFTNSELVSVSLPSTFTSMGVFIDIHCMNLTTINVSPDNPNYASVDGILFNKAKTTLIRCPEGRTGDVTFPSTVTTIGANAFLRCVSVTSITISEGVTTIAAGAFSSCLSLTSITIPSSVTSFVPPTYCTSLTDINVSPDNPNYTSVGGVLYNKDRTHLLNFPMGRTGEFIIPSTVIHIENGAFAHSALTSVTIPSTVRQIYPDAFNSCESLASVTISEGVTFIGYMAFAHCPALTDLTIPSTVHSFTYDVVYANKMILRVPESMTIGGNVQPGVTVVTYTTHPEIIIDFEIVVEDDRITVTNNTVGATTYTWLFGDGQSSTETNPVHYYTVVGDYTVTLIAYNAGGNVAESKSVSVMNVPEVVIDETSPWDSVKEYALVLILGVIGLLALAAFALGVRKKQVLIVGIACIICAAISYYQKFMGGLW